MPVDLFTAVRQKGLKIGVAHGYHSDPHASTFLTDPQNWDNLVDSLSDTENVGRRLPMRLTIFSPIVSVVTGLWLPPVTG
jgi:hypothetical protein